MAPFAHHNGVISSNFGRDSDLEIRFADEDDRFRDKPRGYYQEHEQKLLLGPEPERTTFQPETRIAIDPTTTQDEPTGPSCPSSPQPYEPIEERFPTISLENSQLLKICECNSNMLESLTVVMEEMQGLIELPNIEELTTENRQGEDEQKEWEAFREEEARKDEEVRKLIQEYERRRKEEEEVIQRWTSIAQETINRRTDQEKMPMMTEDTERKMNTNRTLKDAEEVERHFETHEHEQIREIRDLQREIECSTHKLIEQIQSMKAETEVRERELFLQIQEIRETIDANQKKTTRQIRNTTEDLYTNTSRDSRIIAQKLIDTTGQIGMIEDRIRKEITNLKQEMGVWIYEHIVKEIKGMSAWITKQLQDARELNRKEEAENRTQIQEAISHDLSSMLEILMEHIKKENQETRNQNEQHARTNREQKTTDTQLRTYLQKVANFIAEELEKRNVKILEELKTMAEELRIDRAAKQEQEKQNKETQERMKDKVEDLACRTEQEQQITKTLIMEMGKQMEIIRNQLYERLTKDLTISLQKVEDNNRKEHEATRKTITRQPGTEERRRRKPQSDKNTHVRRRREEPNHTHRNLREWTNETTQEEEQEEEEESPERESGQDTPMNPIKRKLITALLEKDDIHTAMKINEIKEQFTTGGQFAGENIPILEALCTTDSKLWPTPGPHCSICDMHITPTQKERHWQETHGKTMKDEIVEDAERLTGTELEEWDKVTTGDNQREIVRNVHRCHYIGCSYESTNYLNTLAHRRKHEGWSRRTTVLGAFWGKIKQEMELIGQADNLPTLRELMGETIEYRCTCGVGSYSYEKLQKHREHRRHYGSIIKREIGFRKVQEEERQEHTNTVTLENPNQDRVGEEVEQEMREERQGRNDLEEAIQQGERTRTEFLTRTLSQKDLKKAARTFINLRHRQKREQEQTALTLDSPITEVLLNLGTTEFPPIHKMKFCPHCCHLFPDQHTLQQHLETIQERDNDTFTEDIKRILVERKLGKVRQIATTLLGVQLEQRGSVHRCRCPGCNYISTDKRKTDLHLEKAKDKDHLIFIEETRECGEIFAFIRGYIRLKGRIPTVRQFLGDYNAPQKMCNLCGEFITSNTTEKHGQQNHPERWRQLSIEEKTQIVKISFTLKEALDQTEIERQREHIFMDGDRRIREEAMDRIYAHLMRQDLEEETRRGTMTEHTYQTRQEQPETEEEAAQQEIPGTTDEIFDGAPIEEYIERETTIGEDENGRTETERESERTEEQGMPETLGEEPERLVTRQREDEDTRVERSENEETMEGRETEETEAQKQLLEYIMGDIEPMDSDLTLQRLLEQLPTNSEWTPEGRIIETLQYLDRKTLMRFGRQCLHCQTKKDSEQELFTHMRKEHGTPQTDWFILALAQATHTNIEIVLTDTEGNKTKHPTSLCHEPGCTYQQTDKNGIRTHMKRVHSETQEDITKWGILMGIIRRYLKADKRSTWNDIFKQRKAFQCECGTVLRDETSINKHFSMVHAANTKTGWRAKFRPVTVDIEITPRGQENDEEAGGNETNTAQTHDERREEQATQERTEEDAPNPTQRTQEIERERNQRRETRNTNEGPQPNGTARERRGTGTNERHNRGPERNVLAAQGNTENNNTLTSRERMMEYYIRRRRELLELEEKGVNLRCVNKDEAAKIKEGLQSLFKNELTPKLEMMIPEPGNERSWLAFEGAYLECLNIIRRHIAEAQEIPANKIYRRKDPPRRINKAKQKQMAEQTINKLISKLRKWIRQEIEEIEEQENPRTNRNRAIRHAKICQVIDSLKEKQVIDIDVTTENLIHQIQDTPEQRQRIMIWLNELFTWTLEKTQGNTKTKKEIRDAYHEDPKMAMKRFVVNEQSPQCTIDTDKIQEFYEKIWAASATPFIEAKEGEPFHIERKCRAEDSDIKERLTDKELIERIVKSRRKLSANGPDGIGYRIFQLGGQEATQFLQTLFEAIWTAHKVPTTWKMAKTVLLYKKGDTKELSNWRPISLTNCSYRIFTAVIAEIIQERNHVEDIFSNTQKGFIARCNGCTEHSIMVNELFNDARRRNTNLITLTIDCTNAFGSVPLELITSTLQQRGIPGTLIDIIRDTYEGASTRITTLGGTTGKILWRKGVKQGCPLSPLLFNLCLEPLFAAFKKINTQDGIIRWIGEEKTQIQAQAYADDIILIADSVEAMQNLIRTTEEFLQWSQMEINTKKCFISSYIRDEERHRATITELLINNEPVKSLTMEESMQYLGIAVAARRRIRFKNNESAVETFLSTLEKIAQSPLAITQKVHAIRMFLMPTLDYVLLNGEMKRSTATKLDKRVRATIGTLLEARGTPKSLIHASWKDGGLSIPSVRDRQNVLTIRAFIQMLNSQDKNIRTIMNQIVQDERKFRKIEESEDSKFLGWKEDDQGKRSGTGTIVVRARKANEELGTKITETAGEVTVWVGRTPFIQQGNKRKTLGWFITNSIIRPRHVEALQNKETKGDQFMDLINNKCSNGMMANRTPHPDNMARFVMAGRCDLLPTPNNIATWTGQEKPICTCGKREHAQITLRHILNDCGFHTRQYMERHNRIMQLIRDVVTNEDDTEILAEDSTIGEGSRLKPDLAIKSPKHIIIIDATCPYGGSILQQDEEGHLIKRGRILEKAFKDKIDKYTPLKEILEERYQMKTEILPIVVSSLGIIYKKTMTEVKRILDIPKKKMTKLMKRLSQAAIEGSYQIWRQRARKDADEGAEDREREEDEELQRTRDDEDEEDENEEEEFTQEDIGRLPLEARTLYRDTL